MSHYVTPFTQRANRVASVGRSDGVGIECEKKCKITLNGEEMEEVNEFKYLGSVMCVSMCNDEKYAQIKQW